MNFPVNKFLVKNQYLKFSLIEIYYFTLYTFLFNNRIYFYGESHIHDTLQVDGKSGTSYVSVWMLAKSSSFKMDQQFPLPADATVDMIKSLIATFTTMRAAKEDLTNDNVDIT